MYDVYHQIYRCLDSDPEKVILITGERGAGKELVAKAIHKYGNRAEDPFVPANCGAIHKKQIEAELFGAKRGAYTGCAEDKNGKFEDADGGIQSCKRNDRSQGDASPRAT